MQEYLVYGIVIACAVWAALRIYHNVNKIRRGEHVCNGCGGACGGKTTACCEAMEKKKNQEK
jgi:hypothetical protein